VSTRTWPTELVPEFTYTWESKWQTVQTPFESGHVQSRATWPRPIRYWRPTWKITDATQALALDAFFHEMSGSADTFYYVPGPKKTPPYCSPVLAQTAGGSLGSRSRYAAFSWADASNETTVSQASNTGLSASYLLTVTVPIFPTNVTKAWVYVGTTGATLKKQATAITTTGGTWTEPTGGYDAGGAAVPTTNTFTETVTAHFFEDSLAIEQINATCFSMQCVLEEVR